MVARMDIYLRYAWFSNVLIPLTRLPPCTIHDVCILGESTDQ